MGWPSRSRASTARPPAELTNLAAELSSGGATTISVFAASLHCSMRGDRSADVREARFVSRTAAFRIFIEGTPLETQGRQNPSLVRSGVLLLISLRIGGVR